MKQICVSQISFSLPSGGGGGGVFKGTDGKPGAKEEARQRQGGRRQGWTKVGP